MKKCSILLISFLLASIQTLAAEVPTTEQVFSLHGQHSLRGSYEGLLVIKADGTVQRTIHYQDFQFEDLDVVEYWVGQAFKEASATTDQKNTIKFQLKKADILTEAEGHKRSDSDFEESLEITFPLLTKAAVHPSQNILYSDLIGTYSETQNLASLDFADTYSTILKDQGERLFLKGTETPTSNVLLKFAKSVLEWRVYDWFHKNPKVKATMAAQKCSPKADPTFVVDYSDYDFYQQNKNTLKVNNKITDTISLIETMNKRNAYAFTLTEKENKIQQDVDQYFINEFGMMSGATVTNGNYLKSYIADGDSALWTGMYIATQSMRYMVTQDEESLERIRKSVRGILNLLSITKNKKEFARSLMAPADHLLTNERWHLSRIQQDGKSVPVVWMETGNNDMYKGILATFLWSKMALPKNDPLLKELEKYSSRLLDLDIARSKTKANSYTTLAIQALYSQKLKYFEQYKKSYINVAGGVRTTGLDAGFYYDGIADWSGINLHTVSVANSFIAAYLLLDTPLGQKNKKFLKEVLMNDVDVLLKQHRTYKNARRDFLTIAALSLLNIETPEQDQQSQRLKQNKLKVDEWNKNVALGFWGLNEIPIERTQYDVRFDFRKRPDFCHSYYPLRPWKNIIRSEEAERGLQATISYPTYEGYGWESNYIWKESPFLIEGFSDKTKRYGGFEYLFTYWLARWSGALK